MLWLGLDPILDPGLGLGGASVDGTAFGHGLVGTGPGRGDGPIPFLSK